MCTSFHRLADPRQFAETRQVAALFDTPFIMIYARGLARGLLTEEAENLGKITIGTELGHSVGVSQRGVAHAHTGVMNVLRHYGLLPGEIEAVDPARGAPPRLVSAATLDCYIPAPISGVYEPVTGLGSLVAAGDLLGRLYRFEEVDREPVPVYAPRPGILIMHSFRAPTQQGDTMLVLAEAVDA
jgi:predicted deacylase